MAKSSQVNISSVHWVNTSTSKSSQDIDEIISNRPDASLENVKIKDSLIDTYNVKLFDGANADLNAQYNTEQLFQGNGNIDDNYVSSSYQDLFTVDVSYHQQMSSDLKINYILIIWLVMMLMICIVVSKIIKIKRKNAN